MAKKINILPPDATKIPEMPSVEDFIEKCSRVEQCSLDVIAREYLTSIGVVWLWIKASNELANVFDFYANHYQHFKNFDLIKSTEFLEANPRLADAYIKRSAFASEHGFINDKDLKLIVPTQTKDSQYTKPRTAFMPVMNSVYYDLLNVNSRYVICYGGAGSGKSYAVATWLLYKLYNSTSPLRILYGRKNFAHIKRSQFDLFRGLISRYNLADEFEINKTDYRIACKHNQSELIAIGLDDPEKIKSIYDPSMAWIEEATELNEEDYHQLDLRLRTENDQLQTIFTFNPISKKHWLRKTFMDNITLPMGEPITRETKVTIDETERIIETYILKTNYKHNKYLQQDYISVLEKMKTINPEYYEIYVNAEWGDAGQGWLFKRDFYAEYSELPTDVRGIIYCDPNLSKKSKGDTTGITKLLFSPTTQTYYIEDVISRSYTDANDLLKDLFSLYHNDNRLIGLAFDGNVAQESQWTQHIRNFAVMYNTPVPVIDYKHYRVDDLAKNASMIWAEGRIKFRRGIKETRDGEEYLGQLYSFTGKKNSSSYGNNNNKDDAPDSLICAVQALFERGYRLAHNNMKNIKGLV